MLSFEARRDSQLRREGGTMPRIDLWYPNKAGVLGLFFEIKFISEVEALDFLSETSIWVMALAHQALSSGKEPILSKLTW